MAEGWWEPVTTDGFGVAQLASRLRPFEVLLCVPNWDIVISAVQLTFTGQLHRYTGIISSCSLLKDRNQTILSTFFPNLDGSVVVLFEGCFKA